jgi:Resolvase, N terminal domain
VTANALASGATSETSHFWLCLARSKASGANTARPVLAKTLAALKSGDTLVVWRLDRLGRSLGHLIEVATVLRERGVFLRVAHRRVRHIMSWGLSPSSSARSSKNAPSPA